MYKVFINTKAIFLTDSPNICIGSADNNCLKFESDKTISKALEVLKNEVEDKVALYSDDIEKLFDSFKNRFKYIEAAGGAVKNHGGKILMIYRWDKWDLPKGKIEKDEKIEVAAIREVEEECNVFNLKIIRPLAPTYHVYEVKGKQVLKKTYWFEMLTESAGFNLIPQTEEGITDVKWMDKEDIQNALTNTYETIKDVLSEVNSQYISNQ